MDSSYVKVTGIPKRVSKVIGAQSVSRTGMQNDSLSQGLEVEIFLCDQPCVVVVHHQT